jgi:hypothetical protein
VGPQVPVPPPHGSRRTTESKWLRDKARIFRSWF